VLVHKWHWPSYRDIFTPPHGSWFWSFQFCDFGCLDKKKHQISAIWEWSTHHRSPPPAFAPSHPNPRHDIAAQRLTTIDEVETDGEVSRRVYINEPEKNHTRMTHLNLSKVRAVRGR
jgi:hypothetical protein